MQKVTFLNILIDVGDYVESDEIIAYVETDKITVDIRSPEAGILT